MHPNLEDFAKIDMKTTSTMLKVVKTIFPSFELTWLGEEMEENLPLEMDFRMRTFGPYVLKMCSN
jgi:aarF domain-containing kinase